MYYHNIGSTLKQRLANVKGKVSPYHLTSRDQKSENLSGKKSVEESLKMEGYEVSFRKPKMVGNGMKQPSAGCGDFWLG
jgi:hypothetical protein